MRRLGFTTALAAGVGLAILFSGIAGIVYGLGGGQELHDAGLGFKEAVATYGIGGVAGGLIFWIVQPLGHTRLGGALVGSLCLLPAGLATAFFLSLGGASTAEAYLGATGGIMIVGALIGFSEGGG